jgi:glycogen operon protein
MLATVLLSQGTPMLLAGDEFANTQNGNNNAYCQDNAVSWLNWEAAEGQADLLAFARRLVALRAAHPALRRARHLHGRVQSPEGVPDIQWISPHGVPVTEHQWHDYYARCLGMLLAGDAGPDLLPDGRHVEDDTLFVVLNAHVDTVPFTMPAPGRGTAWSCVLDTAEPDRPADAWTAAPGEVLPVPARAVLVFVLIRGH